MRIARSNPVVRATVVLGLTVLALVLSAILLPPKGGKAMPRDRDGESALSAPG